MKNFILGLLLGLCLVISIPFTLSTVQWAYSKIDPVVFPSISPLLQDTIKKANIDNDKCDIMATALYSQLHYELHSSFGWTVNDIFISPTYWPNNRRFRQAGVLFATKAALEQFSADFAKYGNNDEEDKNLTKARTTNLVCDPNTWGFMVASAESQFTDVFTNINTYVANVKNKKAVFNVKSDDLYRMLAYINSQKVIGVPMGLVMQDHRDVGFFDINRRTYFIQGFALVIRDFLTALDKCYPSLREKGGSENLNVVFASLNRICMFNPLIVLNGSDSSLFANHLAMLGKELYNVHTRLQDVTESINK